MSRVAVVTGASTGIGREVATCLARDGFGLVVLGRDVDALQRGVPFDSRVVPLDLADTEAVRAAAQDLAGELGRIDALVNCAGELQLRRFDHVSPAELERIWSINVAAPFFLMQGLGSALAEARGAVVNVTSVSAGQGVAAQSAYAATKGALTSMTKAAAAEWGSRGIRVNAVSPGVTLSRMSERSAGIPGYQEYVAKRIPLGRWAEPAEIAECVAFLCSDRAAFVTGEVLTVDGGLSSLYWMSEPSPSVVPAGAG